MSLIKISKEPKKDKDFLEQKMTLFELFLSLTHIEIKEPSNIFEKLKKNPRLIQYIDYDLYLNIDFLVECIKVNPFCFIYLSCELRQNPKIFSEFIRKKSKYIGYVTQNIKFDNHLIIEIIKNVENYKEVIIEIIKNIPTYMFFINPEHFKNDKEILGYYYLDFFKNNAFEEKIPNNLKTDKEFIENLANIDYKTFNKFQEFFILNENDYINLYLKNRDIDIPEKYKDNDGFWFKIIKKNKKYIDYLPNELKNDLEFVALLERLS